jgi:sulfite reductase alpha subunit-like flavoprotein
MQLSQSISSSGKSINNNKSLDRKNSSIESSSKTITIIHPVQSGNAAEYSQKSFNSLLASPDGIRRFQAFLDSERSSENIQFWLRVF